MGLFLIGALLLAADEIWAEASVWIFILPMWIVAVGIVFTGAVTANGALEGFGAIAGTAVAFHFCIQSLIVATFGTLAVVVLDGDTAWPLVAYAAGMAVIVIAAVSAVRGRGRA